ncbi:MAG: NAD(P)-dependent oxidoreductase [Candidatus Levybacteria bacterium]|nr:NAD(P)-dependent oxidoreductase [Candidatus Levybacteria bacterium]
MIIVDTALQKRQDENKPIQVGLIGAGFMARGLALQIQNHTPGMRVAVIVNRTLQKATEAYEFAGIKNSKTVSTPQEVDEAISHNEFAVTSDPDAVIQSQKIDVIVDITGTIEYAADITFKSLKNKKHVVHLNAELEGTLGPILKKYADENGVIYSNSQGDQPGVTMDLYRFVKGLGLNPVLCGNIKGLHDPYRNPTTQEGFAAKWGQKPSMVTSFADGSKISFEQAVIANATNMGVAKRGMHGIQVPLNSNIEDAANWFPAHDLEGRGIVDYVVGASPAPGVFILATNPDPKQEKYLNYYKMGDGPFYCFYTPYHLCHMEIPTSIARVVLFHDAVLTPLGKPSVDVIAAAKRDLKAGQILDGIGEYDTYGLCENYDTARAQNLLPIGLAQGCILNRDIKKDEVITFADVILPEGRISDKLWSEQVNTFK